MISKEKELAGFLLKMAAEEFANHGCNDMDEYLTKGWTDEEKIAFVREYGAFNGDPEEYQTLRDFKCLPDFAFFRFLSHKLMMEAIAK